MDRLSTSAGPVAYESRGAGAKLVVIDSGHLPHTTDPAAVAAELVPLADSAFANNTQTLVIQPGPTTTKEQP
jgi:hypothetical protein